MVISGDLSALELSFCDSQLPQIPLTAHPFESARLPRSSEKSAQFAASFAACSISQVGTEQRIRLGDGIGSQVERPLAIGM